METVHTRIVFYSPDAASQNIGLGCEGDTSWNLLGARFLGPLWYCLALWRVTHVLSLVPNCLHELNACFSRSLLPRGSVEYSPGAVVLIRWLVPWSTDRRTFGLLN